MIVETGDYVVDLCRCIYRDCTGEPELLETFTTNTWITVVYRCAECGREFTVKIEA